MRLGSSSGREGGQGWLAGGEGLVTVARCGCWKLLFDSCHAAACSLPCAACLWVQENKKIRFLMRQDKTLKIRSNHISERCSAVVLLLACSCGAVASLLWTLLHASMWRRLLQ